MRMHCIRGNTSLHFLTLVKVGSHPLLSVYNLFIYNRIEVAGVNHQLFSVKTTGC